jgi:hypothetical protein
MKCKIGYSLLGGAGGVSFKGENPMAGQQWS